MNRLYRSPDDRVFGGVAGGMAEAYDLDPALVRLGWAFLILVSGGLFLLLYIIMVLVVPLRPGQQSLWSASAPMSQPGPGGQPGTVPPPGAPAEGPWSAPPAPSYEPLFYRHRRERRDGAGALVLGVLLIFVGAAFLIREFIPALNWDLVWPLIVIGGGALLIAAAFNRPGHHA